MQTTVGLRNRGRHRSRPNGTTPQHINEPVATDSMLAVGWSTDSERSDFSVDEYLERWLEDHARLRVKPSTLLRYRQLVRRLEPLIGDVRLTELHPTDIQRSYVSLLDSGLAAQTVVHHHRMLRQALDQARGSGLIAANPTDAVSTPRVERREMRTLSGRDVSLLEKTAGDTDLRRLIHVAVSTGLRLGELLGLEWNDIDFERHDCMCSGRLFIGNAKPR